MTEKSGEMEDLKQSEIETYDRKEESTLSSHAAIWDSDDMAWLTDIGAEDAEEEYIKEAAEGGSILDIACGMGHHVERNKKYTQGISVGIDISIEQLKKAPNSTIGSLFQGDVERLPFQNDVFEVVTAHAALHHLPQLDEETLPEIKRVLEPEGTLVFYEPSKYNPPAAIRRHFMPSSSHTVGESPFDARRLHELLQSHFGDVEIHSHYILSNVFPAINKTSPIRIPRRIIRKLYQIEQQAPLPDRIYWILVGKASAPRVDE